MEKFPEYEQDRPKLEIELRSHLGQFIGTIIKILALNSYVMGVPCREMTEEDWEHLQDVFIDYPRTVREYMVAKTVEKDLAIETVLGERNNDEKIEFLDRNLVFFFNAIRGKSRVAFWHYCQILFNFVAKKSI